MKQFQRDIKTILTRTAFNIPSHLVGTQLATPKRRLAALLTDLLIAAILSSLIGKTMWLVVAIAFMTPTFSKSLRIKLKKSVRIFLFITGLSIIVCFSIGKIGTGFYQRYIKPIETGKFQSQEDSLAVQEIIDNIAENTTSQEIEEVQSALKKVEVNNVNLSKLFNLDLTASADENSINNDNIILIENFYTSYKDQDTTKLMEYWPSMESLIAGEKIEHLENEIDTLDQEIEDLEDELEEKNELLEDPSFSYIVKALTNDIGLSLGWIAVYMIFAGLFLMVAVPEKNFMELKSYA